MTGRTAPRHSTQRQMIHGMTWAVVGRWFVRLTGLVNTVLLARLLTPADYGIVAIAMIVVGTVEVLAQNGQDLAIVRLENPTRDYYDSAWTVSLLTGLGLGLIIIALQPLASSYFNEPRSEAVIAVLAFRTMLQGTRNIGVVNFQRRLEFDKQFWLRFYPALVSVVVTVTSAFILRSYWALVIGIMSQHAVAVLLSYVMEPFRPRISFTRVREIWSFSIWLLARTIGAHLNGVVDRIAVGGFAGAAEMGRYEVAQDLATSPTMEVINPMVTTLFPVLAKVQQDHEKRRALYLSVLYWSALIAVSTSVGVALVVDDMVDIILGSQWELVKPLMPWFALSVGLFGLSSSVYSALETVGLTFISARLQWIRLGLFVIAVFPVAFYFHDLEAVAITRFFVAGAVTPTLFYALSRTLNVPMRDIVVTLWRPLTAGLVMAAVVLGLNVMIGFEGPLRLLLDIAAGSTSFAAAIMLLWLVAGRPLGPETYLADQLRSGRLFARRTLHPAKAVLDGTDNRP